MKLTNWEFKSFKKEYFARGCVWGSKKFSDGITIVTSKIQHIETDQKNKCIKIQTKNSVYELYFWEHDELNWKVFPDELRSYIDEIKAATEKDVREVRIPKEMVNGITDGIVINVDNSREGYFVSKHYYKGDKFERETNFHIADGMFSTYCNCETRNNSVSYEYSHGSIRFEIDPLPGYAELYIHNCGYYPVFVRNSFYKCIAVNPGDLVKLEDDSEMPESKYETFEDYMDHMADHTVDIYECKADNWLTQEEVNRLLNGLIPDDDENSGRQ